MAPSFRQRADSTYAATPRVTSRAKPHHPSTATGAEHQCASEGS